MPDRPNIYNRPWHLDQDDRRHHGRRRWDPAAIEALVQLLSSLDDLYPPDWSCRDAIRFRAAGASEPFAELWTDKPSTLRLLVYLEDPPRVAIDGCRACAGDRNLELLLKSPEALHADALKDLIGRAISESRSNAARSR